MILVTGGYGCIGAELVKVVTGRIRTSRFCWAVARSIPQRTERIFDGVDRERLQCVELDVADAGQTGRVVSEPSDHAHRASRRLADSGL